MPNDDPINRPPAVREEQDQRIDALAITPVGFGAQRVTESQIRFPDGTDTGWVVTIGGAVAYVTEDTMVDLAYAVLGR